MLSINQKELELMRQEMLYENKLAELEAREHEQKMQGDTDYFCEWVLDNLMKKGVVSLRDMIEELNGEIRKYNQDIDYVYDYFKEI